MKKRRLKKKKIKNRRNIFISRDQSGESQCNAAGRCDVGGIYKSIIDAAVDLYRGVHDAGLEGEPWCST